MKDLLTYNAPLLTEAAGIAVGMLCSPFGANEIHIRKIWP